jgi:hypothetical protein
LLTATNSPMAVRCVPGRFKASVDVSDRSSLECAFRQASYGLSEGPSKTTEATAAVAGTERASPGDRSSRTVLPLTAMMVTATPHSGTTRHSPRFAAEDEHGCSSVSKSSSPLAVRHNDPAPPAIACQRWRETQTTSGRGARPGPEPRTGTREFALQTYCESSENSV